MYYIRCCAELWVDNEATIKSDKVDNEATMEYHKHMIIKDKIIELCQKEEKITTAMVVNKFNLSRQYVSKKINELVEEGVLLRIHNTRYSFYVLAKDHQLNSQITAFQYKESFKNIDLEEHKVLDQIEKSFPFILKLPENIRSVFTYAFSEMFNNAIEHSKSDKINIMISIINNELSFIIEDFGIGVFRNIMKKKELDSEYEAMRDLLKGKTTTMPKSHSGEGIFFTSKACDEFVLDSFGYELLVDNKINDVFIKQINKTKRGTKVFFKINIKSDIHLIKVFEKYTDKNSNDGYGFDKTEVRIKLYTMGGVHISRSQARRVLSGLEKFNIVVFDFDKVPVVGQAFADEIFRVFHNKYPKINLQAINMEEGVRFMVERAKVEAGKGL